MNINEIIKHANISNDEKKVIDILYREIKNGNDRITVRELSKSSYASTGSIVRLAKKMGFYGYSDMVYSFRKQFEEVVEFDSSDTLSSVILSKESLDITDQLVKDICSSSYKRVHLQGLGYSNIVCEYMRDKLVELNIFATCSNPLDLEDEDPFIVVFVSNSGESVDLLRTIERCKNKNCKMYALSSQDNSRICSLVENHIVITHKRNHQRTTYFTGNAIILMEKIANAIYNNKK